MAAHELGIILLCGWVYVKCFCNGVCQSGPATSRLLSFVTGVTDFLYGFSVTLLLSVVTGVTDFLDGFSVTLLPSIVTDVAGFLRVVTNMSLILSLMNLNWVVFYICLLAGLSNVLQDIVKVPWSWAFSTCFLFLVCSA